MCLHEITFVLLAGDMKDIVDVLERLFTSVNNYNNKARNQVSHEHHRKVITKQQKFIEDNDIISNTSTAAKLTPNQAVGA